MFHLWRKKNVVKYQKVSKYYDHVVLHVKDVLFYLFSGNQNDSSKIKKGMAGVGQLLVESSFFCLKTISYYFMPVN